jgi:hypothetical protein
LVAAYHVQVERYNQNVDPEAAVRLHPPSHRDLREVGIDDTDGEIWDVERLLCNVGWAVHIFVRRCIDARVPLQQVPAERKFLLLRVDMILRSLSQHTAALFQVAASRSTRSNCVTRAGVTASEPPGYG